MTDQPADHFCIESRPDGVAVQGTLDIAAAPAFDAELERLATLGDVVVDLRNLSFMDSTGVRCFVQLRHRMATGDTLYLHGPSGIVRKVIELTGLGQAAGIIVRYEDTTSSS